MRERLNNGDAYDLKLFLRALREGWDVPLDAQRRMLAVAQSLMENGDDRNKVKAAQVLLAMDQRKEAWVKLSLAELAALKQEGVGDAGEHLHPAGPGPDLAPGPGPAPTNAPPG